jgi:hypothetical protein
MKNIFEELKLKLDSLECDFDCHKCKLNEIILEFDCSECYDQYTICDLIERVNERI